MEVRLPSPTPMGPSALEGVPPERAEGDWRLAGVSPGSSTFRDYGLAENLFDFILLPRDRE